MTRLSVMIFAVTLFACSDDSSTPTPDVGPDTTSPRDGQPPRPDGEAEKDSLPDPDGPKLDAEPGCFVASIGTACAPDGQTCPAGMMCLVTEGERGVCACDCTPASSTTADTCPEPSKNVCREVKRADGGKGMYCLRACTPQLGANDCPSGAACDPASGLEGFAAGEATCMATGCTSDDDCPVITAEACTTDGMTPCADSAARCISVAAGRVEGRCALPGNCDMASALCAPRTTNFDAAAKIGDPCADDNECGAAMQCEYEVDTGALGALPAALCVTGEDCCNGDCTSQGICGPMPCPVHARNGYCFQKDCEFGASLTEYACPAGSTCNKAFSGGVCFKSCDLADASTCRGVSADLAGDYECRAWNNFDSAEGPTCEPVDLVSCSFFAPAPCSAFGQEPENATAMRCMTLAGVDTNHPNAPDGYCQDDTHSGANWR